MEEWLGRLIATQFGLVGRSQCLAHGMSPSSIRHRIGTGQWEVLAAGVYRLAGYPPSFEQAQMVAVLAGRGAPVVSHRSAAVLWKLDLPRWTQPEVTVARGGLIYNVPGLVIHEAAFGPGDVFRMGELPVTTAARTLLDLGAVLSDDCVERALESAIRLRLVSYDYLHRRLAASSVRGRSGLGALRRVLKVRGDVPATESELETRCLQAIRAAGLPRPVRQYQLWVDGRVVARFDLAYPKLRVNVEAHGMRFHTDELAIVRDWDRQNIAVAEGWRPFIFTHRDAMDPGPAMGRLARLLAAQEEELKAARRPSRPRRRRPA